MQAKLASSLSLSKITCRALLWNWVHQGEAAKASSSAPCNGQMRHHRYFYSQKLQMAVAKSVKSVTAAKKTCTLQGEIV